MKFARHLVNLAVSMLDLEVAIIATDADKLGEEKTSLALDSHKKAMERLTNALPQNVDVDELLNEANKVLERQKEERAAGLKARREIRRERLAEKQMMLG